MAYDFVRASSQRLTTATAPVAAVPLTIAAWVRPTSSATARTIAALNNADDTRSTLALSTGRAVVAQQSDINLTFGTATTSATIATGVWGHAAAVFPSGIASRSAYLNGGSKTTNTVSLASQSNFATVGIGVVPVTNVNHMDGGIADVGVWNVALTDQEILSLASGVSCLKVRPQSLVFYAPLIRGLIDVCGGRVITNTNTATVSNHPRLYL